MQKFVPQSRVGFYATNAPDPRHWTLNSWFDAFLNVLGAFGTVSLLHKTRCRTDRIGVANVKVHAMKSHQNFLQRTNPIHTIGHKLVFWCVSYHLGAFGTVLLHHKTQCRTGRTGAINAKFCAMKSHRNFFKWMQRILFQMNAANPHHSTLNSYIGAFRTVWLHLRPFRYGTILYAKLTKILQLMQKYVTRSRVGIFCNDRSQPTTIDPNLMFWCVSYHLGAFGTVSLLHETWCKKGRTGAINAKVRATKSRLKFSQRAHPVHTIGP
jgi:hypothetical protein